MRNKTPYFCFSPPDVDVDPIETNIQTLVEMVIHTKKYLCQQEQMSAMHEITEILTAWLCGNGAVLSLPLRHYVCVFCRPVPSLHSFDFYEIIFILVLHYC